MRIDDGGYSHHSVDMATMTRSPAKSKAGVTVVESYDVAADTKKRINEVKAGLKDGSFSIWKGPITDNTGKELLAAGMTADDKFLGGLKTYVKGVEGKVPGGN